eukprot:TRINITY_DN3543_c0_g1_i1.p1 TRINITY_DN3543_c0_g1~~TRINITY_DN3543_c0_g1_i1.p1  ORF type:complete len:402 (-),score=131.00 TRINITY_DN3543_c0_g1_i1:516-1721(-)
MLLQQHEIKQEVNNPTTNDECVILSENIRKNSSLLTGNNLSQIPPPPADVNLKELLRVRPNTALHSLMNANNALILGAFTCLGQILCLIREKIARGRLFDAHNPVIILCDQELENILDVKALHCNQMRQLILKSTVLARSLFPKKEPSPVSAKNSPSDSDEHEEVNTNSDNNDEPENQADVEQDAAANIAEDDDKAPGELVIDESDSAADNHDAAVYDNAGNNDNVNNNNNNSAADSHYYAVSPLLRQVLGLPTRSQPMTFKAVCSAVSAYILARKSKLFDYRNHLVAVVGHDRLGLVFGVKAFHRDQTTWLVKQHLKPVKDLVAFNPVTADDAFQQQIREIVAGKRRVCGGGGGAGLAGACVNKRRRGVADDILPQHHTSPEAGLPPKKRFCAAAAVSSA